ncbi:MAG: hypothetical protein ACM3WV_11200 [Bacillota bacterium]
MRKRAVYLGAMIVLTVLSRTAVCAGKIAVEQVTHTKFAIRWFTVTAYGDILYVHGGSRALCLYKTATGKITEIAPRVKNLAVSLDQKLAGIRVANRNISILDLRTRKEVAKLSNLGDIDEIFWTRDNRYLIYAVRESGKSQNLIYYKINYLTKKKERIFRGRLNNAKFSEDGKYLYYQNKKNIYALDMAGKHRSKRILSTRKEIYSFAPNRDNSLLYWGERAGADPEFDLYYKNLKTGKTTKINRLESVMMFFPYWSPDSSFLMFAAARKDQLYHLYKYDLATKKLIELESTGSKPFTYYDGKNGIIYFAKNQEVYRARI